MGSQCRPATPQDWVFENYMDEVHRQGVLTQWPIYLALWLPEGCPPEWWYLVANRLVMTVGRAAP